MNLDMYIYTDSFTHNGKDSDYDVIERLNKFTELTTKVGTNFRDDNRFYANYNELNETKLFSDGTTFLDMLYGNCSNNYELNNTFLLILSSGYLESTELPANKIDCLITNNTEDNCYAKVVLSKENAYSNGNCIVATYEDWLIYRSELLGKFPGTCSNFYQECERYYENLVISKDLQSASKQVLETHSAQICYILYCINTYMLTEFSKFKDSNIQFPHYFAKKYDIEDGSFEGNGKTKRKYLIMSFPEGEKTCEAHFKYNSINGVKKFNDVRDYCRVYFSIPKEGDTKIYIGAILNHTKQCN